MSRKKTDISKFKSRAHQILWNADVKLYKQWEDDVEEAQRVHGWSPQSAAVQVSKDYKELKDLFGLYDVGAYDPLPGTSGGLKCREPEKKDGDIKCLDLEITYRQQLRWAAEAAGRYENNGEEPAECPCWSAYYLYVQAKENPKEFMAKVGQVESKSDADADRIAGHKQSSKRNVEEINEMLDALFNEEEESEEEEDE